MSERPRGGEAPQYRSDQLDIEYTSPRDQSPEDEPKHTFHIRNETGEIIGGAELDYYSGPLPIYQVTEVWVEPEYAGKGNASRIMDEVEAFLRERHKPGVLVDAIPQDEPAHGMYERRGWQPVPGVKGQFVYSGPKTCR